LRETTDGHFVGQQLTNVALARSFSQPAAPFNTDFKHQSKLQAHNKCYNRDQLAFTNAPAGLYMTFHPADRSGNSGDSLMTASSFLLEWLKIGINHFH